MGETQGMTSRSDAVDGRSENPDADATEIPSGTFTLEVPDPEGYRSGPTPLSSSALTEQLRESDRETNRHQRQTWALAVIMTLAASVLVLIAHLV
ncbi:hypothetical protein E5CHR_04766 [Variovorax sp. PBL-E5]|nr:hypothetical protein [Variovorax sp. SRS16]VTU38228.1 hypothetical protein E5CHR_04766 [Variovorax sp. PBL-E5]